MQMIIGFVGLPGAGKSTALAIAKQYAPVVVMGDEIRREARIRDLPPTGENLGQIAKELREIHGKGVVARRCASYIRDLDYDVVIVDGIRSMDELRVFQQFFTVIIIAVEAPASLRYQWIKNRGRSDDNTSLDQIIRRDQREQEFGVQNVIEHADYRIQNSGTIADLQAKTTNIIHDLIPYD